MLEERERFHLESVCSVAEGFCEIDKNSAASWTTVLLKGKLAAAFPRRNRLIPHTHTASSHHTSESIHVYDAYIHTPKPRDVYSLSLQFKTFEAHFQNMAPSRPYKPKTAIILQTFSSAVPLEFKLPLRKYSPSS